MQEDKKNHNTVLSVQTPHECKMSFDALYLNILKTSNTFSQFAKMIGLLVRQTLKLRACRREVVQM